MKDIMDIQEAAVALGVHHNTVRRLVKQGLLPAIRITERGDFRFKRADIETYLSERVYVSA
ncbi:MAG: helix-turn-helix domain-containing protein [Dehalococcoidia bacterium]|nr:helix-turn-helix domain-containing protein [Dehalococcoidia bacterium]